MCICLIMKTFWLTSFFSYFRKTPKVEKFRSAVHELYMRPYNYVSYEMGGGGSSATQYRYQYHTPSFTPEDVGAGGAVAAPSLPLSLPPSPPSSSSSHPTSSLSHPSSPTTSFHHVSVPDPVQPVHAPPEISLPAEHGALEHPVESAYPLEREVF